MPRISEHNAARTTKMLLIGNSGSGKTGALFSLAQAGYNLRILDFDNGSDILYSLARKLNDPKVSDRIVYETFTDTFKAVNGKPMVSGLPSAFTKGLNMLNNWKVADVPAKDGKPAVIGYDLGPVASWGEKDVLVIDSLTHMSLAAFRLTLAMNQRTGQPPTQADWGIAQTSIESLLALLYSTEIKCNVIVLCHIVYLGGEEDDKAGTPVRGLPMSLGKALSPKIGSYFNTAVLVKVVGSGPSARRKIVTIPDGVIELKNSAPATMPKELPLETGLADIFRILRE